MAVFIGSCGFRDRGHPGKYTEGERAGIARAAVPCDGPVIKAEKKEEP
jgi:hypothetical protein